MMVETINYMKVCLATMVELKRCERFFKTEEEKKKLADTFALGEWIYNYELENLKKYRQR